MAENRHISIGRLGEDIAAGYLKRRGFVVLARNYRKKFGELDIVAQKDGVLHFVEVKAGRWNAEMWPREGKERYRPEDHMHAQKCLRMSRAIQAYLAEQQVPDKREWTADLMVVLINENTRTANVRVLHNIVL